MNEYERALALKEETVAHRRHIHQNAEVGLELPKTCTYVKEEMAKCGINLVPCGHGLTATIGQGGKTILLRADMDALPMQDLSGEPFACPTGTEAHCCGHDLHTAMLMTAAKILKEQEADLKGTVKLMFQPAEEIFLGGKDMIAAGILENPHVDAALAYHVTPGNFPVGLFLYNDSGLGMMASVDVFRITITGKGAHGAMPHTSIDPINIGVHIHQALQTLIAREADAQKTCVLTIGQFLASGAPNIIPNSAILEGTLRTNDRDQRALLVRRIKEVAQGVAATFGGSAEVEILSDAAPVICPPDLVHEMVGYMQNSGIPGIMGLNAMVATGSEDFAEVTERVPSVFMGISAGYMDERGAYPQHNPRVQFNEEVLPIGATCLAVCARRWLENHA